MKIVQRKQWITITTIIAWLVVIGVLIKGIQSVFFYFNHETTNDAQVVEYINPVIARVSGYISEVRFNDFDQVKKGDTLLVINNEEYRLDANQIGAELLKQSANDQVVNKQIQTLTAEAAEAKERINAAKAQVWKQQLEYERYEKLYDQKSSTAQQLEQVKATLEIYKSTLSEAEQHYLVAVAKIDNLKQEKYVIKAEQSRLNELHQRKHLDVGYTVITAPYDGRLGKRKIEKGQMVSVGDHLCYIVNSETPKWVMANFKETQIAHFKVGDEVTIVADAYPDYTFKGKVLSLSPATGSSFSLLPPDNATGNFVKIVQRIPVKIELVTLDKAWKDKLLSGMNVTVTIPHD